MVESSPKFLEFEEKAITTVIGFSDFQRSDRSTMFKDRRYRLFNIETRKLSAYVARGTRVKRKWVPLDQL